MKNVKKMLVSLMAAAASAVSLCVVSASSAANVKYNTYSYYFDVPENTYIKTCNANVSYNPNNVEFVKSSNGNLGGTFSVSDVGINETSKKTYVEYNNSSPSNKSGNLGYVTFKTTSAIPSFSVTLVKNDRNNTLVTSTVKVNRILMGDVNLDGVVNDTDMTYFQKYMIGSIKFNETQFRAADLDGDGSINGADFTRLMMYLEGSSDSVLG
ncbi:MAG: dockerin type I repeat-containing protein [Ruminococcus flavefaciens]|nr:dockerin type I repeat-containing protein [Ruminococcus flavefaciens]MCM1360864.1 dockerin type I repeat-containing protein [Clostridiales bacterium]